MSKFIKLLSTSSSILLTTVIMTGCSSTPKKHPYQYWAKEGMTAEEVQLSKNKCRKETGAEFSNKDVARKNMYNCMRVRGYHLKTGYNYK